MFGMGIAKNLLGRFGQSQNAQQPCQCPAGLNAAFPTAGFNYSMLPFFTPGGDSSMTGDPPGWQGKAINYALKELIDSPLSPYGVARRTTGYLDDAGLLEYFKPKPGAGQSFAGAKRMVVTPRPFSRSGKMSYPVATAPNVSGPWEEVINYNGKQKTLVHDGGRSYFKESGDVYDNLYNERIVSAKIVPHLNFHRNAYGSMDGYHNDYGYDRLWNKLYGYE